MKSITRSVVASALLIIILMSVLLLNESLNAQNRNPPQRQSRRAFQFDSLDVPPIIVNRSSPPFNTATFASVKHVTTELVGEKDGSQSTLHNETDRLMNSSPLILVTIARGQDFTRLRNLVGV